MSEEKCATEQHQELLQKLKVCRDIVDSATLLPWNVWETKDFWSLHGETRDFKGKVKDGGAPTTQILKAPKHGTKWAEYWPNNEDALFMLEAVSRYPFFLDWAEDVLKRHHPWPCGCKREHFLCFDHRVYDWDRCPEIIGLKKALDQIHMIGWDIDEVA